jgi:hypothetical protein
MSIAEYLLDILFALQIIALNWYLERETKKDELGKKKKTARVFEEQLNNLKMKMMKRKDGT